MIQPFRVFLTLAFAAITVLSGAQEQSIIHGQIRSEANKEIRLVYNKVPFINKPLELRTKTDSNGKFFIQFPIDRKASLDFFHGTQSISLVISPKDSIYMDIVSGDSMYSYVLSGRGHQESYLNYLNYKNFDREVIKTFHDQVKNLDTVAYDLKVKAWMKQYDKVLKENLKTVEADKTLKKLAERMALIKEANYYLIYANYRRSTNPQVPFPLPASFAKVIQNPELYAIDYTPGTEYQNFLLLHLTTLGPAPREDVCAGVMAFLHFVDSVYAKKSKDELMARVLWEGMDNGCFRPMKLYYDAYVATSSYPDYVQTLQAKAAQLVTLEPGDPAPDFEFVDKDGNKHSFKDLRGKVIYLDFWATWCGPCIQSMKLSAPLKEKFKDNPDVAFVYVSTDQNITKWQGHYITNSGEANMWHVGSNDYAVSMAYRIQTIPRYVIIDKEGRIVNANAPRPHAPEIEAILLQEAAKPYPSN